MAPAVYLFTPLLIVLALALGVALLLVREMQGELRVVRERDGELVRSAAAAMLAPAPAASNPDLPAEVPPLAALAFREDGTVDPEMLSVLQAAIFQPGAVDPTDEATPSVVMRADMDRAAFVSDPGPNGEVPVWENWAVDA